MVIILIYYLLLVYQLATLTNLIEELDSESKSIDIVTLYLTLNLPCSLSGGETGESGGGDRNLSNAPACRNIWLSFEFNLKFINY